jgi:glucokinase
LCRGPNQPRVGRLDVAGGLADRLGRPVRVDNDANCALRAEAASGAAQGERDVVLVTLGTGIGGALLVDGTLVRGAHGLAGEPGHMLVDPTGPRCVCGRRGCWERYASGAGLARLAREAADAGRLEAILAACGGQTGAIDGEAVVAAARTGDGSAQEVLDAFSWWTAVGLANLAAVLDPAVLVLGGGLVDAADRWLDEVRRRFPTLLVAAEDRPLPRLVAAVHGSAATAVGAALLAAEQ